MSESDWIDVLIYVVVAFAMIGAAACVPVVAFLIRWLRNIDRDLAGAFGIIATIVLGIVAVICVVCWTCNRARTWDAKAHPEVIVLERNGYYGDEPYIRVESTDPEGKRFRVHVPDCRGLEKGATIQLATRRWYHADADVYVARIIAPPAKEAP